MLNLVQAFSERWVKQASQPGELINLRNLNLDVPNILTKEGGFHAQTSRSIDARINYFDRSIEQSEKNVRTTLMSSSKWECIEEQYAPTSRRFESTKREVEFNRILDRKKGRLIDNSIHLTMVHQIRRAKHFIYIESQYFMGSSFMWLDSSDRKVKCNNLIPSEVRKKLLTRVISHFLFCQMDFV